LRSSSAADRILSQADRGVCARVCEGERLPRFIDEEFANLLL